MVTLREYQKQAIEAVDKKFDEGVNKIVIVLATGTGKTVIFSSIISERIKATGKKALIIAHREELLTQARDKLLRVDPTLRIGIEQAGSHALPSDCDVIVASVPTLGRLKSERIKKLDPKDFCIVVVDEAHHASNDTYMSIFKYMGVMLNDPDNDWNKDCLLLGVTATPSRNDNKGINLVFQDKAFVYAILDGMQDKYLARVKAYRVNTMTDLTQVKKTAGDFNLGELGNAVNTEDRNGLIVKAYQKLTPGKQALCFAVDVAHTMELTKRFLEEGIKANYVVGTTPKEERAQLLADFAAKKINVMVNAMVLTEGYDNETIEVILMGRPTQSGILFQQMVGRGTRIHPDKECLTVVDFVDNTYKQNLQTSSSLLGYSGALDFKGRDIMDVKEEVDKLLELAPNADLAKIDIEKIKYAIEEVDLMSGIKVPEEIGIFTTFGWHRFGEDQYRLSLGNDHHITVIKNITDQYEVTDEHFDKVTKKQQNTLIGKSSTLESGIKGADYYVNKKFPEQIILIKQNATWHKAAPSDSQKQLLMKLRVPELILSQLNKGEASRLITNLLNNRQFGGKK